MIYVWWSLYAVAWVAIAFVLLYVAKKLFDLLTPYSVEVQLTEKDNPAVGLVLAGFLLGVVAIIIGVFQSGEETDGTFSLASMVPDLLPVLLYSIVGMFLLFFAGIINDKAVLYKFCNQKEIVEERNLGVAAIVAVTYLGSGLIVCGGMVGAFDMLSALVAYAVGQVGLVVFAAIYQKMTSYDDLKELGEHKNVAAGVAFSGNLLAYAIVLMKGVSMTGGAVETRLDRASHFFYYAILGCLLLFVIRFITDNVFLPKEKLSKEIAEDRNLSAGFVEAGLALASGLILVHCL